MLFGRYWRPSLFSAEFIGGYLLRPRLPQWLYWSCQGVGLALSFFLFGFTLLVVVPIYNWILPTRVRPFKGGYYTLQAAPWFLHNGLFYLVRFTYPSPEPPT